MDTRALDLADGRRLEVAETGPADGPVLLFHHGTPGSVHQRRFFARAVHARGWRLVTYSRAGYGASSRLPGRTVADVVPDMQAVLDAVGVERAMVAGASGGGPHALACAALMPERTSAALTIAGVGAYGLDLDFLAGMGQDNVDEFSAALAGEQPLRDYLEAQAADLRHADAEQLIAALDSLLPDVDRAVLTGELGEDTLAGLQRGIVGGVDGWIDDDLAFTRPWGFELEAIEVPVSIWQGDADLMVPFAHGQWLAGRVPGARTHLEAGQGHLSITVGAVERMLDELAALTG
jgi:pimeloyl-ACP methyl ester carboxylesterase